MFLISMYYFIANAGNKSVSVSPASTNITIIKIFTKLIGNKYFHSKLSSKSIRKRGNDQRTHKLKKIRRNVFPKNQTYDGMYHMAWLKPSNPGICNGIHPPKNTVVAMDAIINIFRYSAK